MNNAKQSLAARLNQLNEQVGQGLFDTPITQKDVLGSKQDLKNNVSMAELFLKSKNIEPTIHQNTASIPDAALPLLSDVQALEFNADIKNNPKLLNDAFDALYLDPLRKVIADKNESSVAKSMAEKKIARFSNATDDAKFNLIDNSLSKIKSAEAEGVNKQKTKDGNIS